MRHRDLVPLLCAAFVLFVALAVVTVAPVQPKAMRGAANGGSSPCPVNLGDLGV